MKQIRVEGLKLNVGDTLVFKGLVYKCYFNYKNINELEIQK